MGVRQKLNEDKKLGVGLGAAILVLALGLITYQLLAGSRAKTRAPRQAFYTDDGKTFFTDDVRRISPFDHNGRQAYRADVFQCADGTRFVAFIYRHTETGRREMEGYIDGNLSDSDANGSMLRGIELRSMEFRRAGAENKAWRVIDESVIESLRAAVACPSGGGATLVEPEL